MHEYIAGNNTACGNKHVENVGMKSRKTGLVCFSTIQKLMGTSIKDERLSQNDTGTCVYCCIYTSYTGIDFYLVDFHSATVVLQCSSTGEILLYLTDVGCAKKRYIMILYVRTKCVFSRCQRKIYLKWTDCCRIKQRSGLDRASSLLQALAFHGEIKCASKRSPET